MGRPWPRWSGWSRSSAGRAVTGRVRGGAERRAVLQHAPTVDGVTLASLHSAKGLEWDAVFLAGLVEGCCPRRTRRRRTRWRRSAGCCMSASPGPGRCWSCRTPSPRPGGRARRPSRFLPVEEAAAGYRSRDPDGTRRRVIATPCRGDSRCGPDRRGRASSAGVPRARPLWMKSCSPGSSSGGCKPLRRKVPAYVVFTDATHRRGRAPSDRGAAVGRHRRNRAAQTGLYGEAARPGGRRLPGGGRARTRFGNVFRQCVAPARVADIACVHQQE